MTNRISFLFVAALIAQLGNCGHHGGHHHSTGVPSVVHESGKAKECPAGFDWLGKECIQTLSVPAEVRCPAGHEFVDDGAHHGEHNQHHNEQHGSKLCAKYSGKLSQCPAGYSRSDGLCKSLQEAESESFCPDDYAFTADSRQCVRNVPLPSVFYCPPNTQKRGDWCVLQKSTVPQLVCAPGYVLEGKRCFSEETYDCTPEQSKEGNISMHKHHHKLRMLGSHAKHNSPYMPAIVTVPAKPTSPPTVSERIVQKTCKRSHAEDAKKICPPGSQLIGKGCIIEEHVNLLTKPGGFREEYVQPLNKCPPGYYTSGSKFGKCLNSQETLPSFYCPSGTQPAGNKCAVFRPPLAVCPADFRLDHDGICAKVIRAQPLVEFTVTYACQGKECDNEHSGHSHHKH